MAASKTPLIVAAVVIAAVAAVTLLVSRGGPDGEASLDTVPAATADAAPTSAPARVTPPRSAPPAPVDRVQASMDRRATLREEHIARTTRAREEAIARFAQESVDPAWAPQKQQELSAITEQPAFETAGVAPRSLAVECKSSMCRIDGTFASNSEAEDWVLIYMSSVGNGLPNSLVSRTANPDGSTRVLIHGRGR